MSKSVIQDRIKWIELYRNRTGKKEIDMHDVAKFALANGYAPPTPKTVEEIVTAQLSRAARQHVRCDPETGDTYRVNHRIPAPQGQGSLWLNLDDGPSRHKMLLSLNMRRDQTVGDVFQMTIDAERWNRVCPDQKPIQMPLDFTFDVALRRQANANDQEQLAS